MPPLRPCETPSGEFGVDVTGKASPDGRADTAGADDRVPPTILIVDDEPAITEILADLLADEGYRVATAADGVAVPDALTEAPGLVLLDVMMPDVDGIEVCRRLQADARTADVPIILVTAASPETLERRAGACRCAGVICKPYRLDQILDAVHQHLPM